MFMCATFTRKRDLTPGKKLKASFAGGVASVLSFQEPVCSSAFGGRAWARRDKSTFRPVSQ
jgi:hypothetical protein